MVLEICLLIIGAVAVILSFVLSERLTSKDKTVISADNIDVASIAGDKIREKVDIEVDDTIEEKVEKFDLELDKISNEKIMAMGDYSTTILDEIKKNHNEVLFLYNMLKDKETDVKKMVIDVENLKKSIRADQNIDDIELTANSQIEQSFVKKAESELKNFNEAKSEAQPELKESSEEKTASELKPEAEIKEEIKPDKEINKDIVEEINPDEDKDSDNEKINNNDRILELMEQGKSIVQIAKELGLGVGEVRLVVDLFKEKR